MSSPDLQRTSLFEHHLELKAKMAPFAGFAMPVQYTSVKDEVLAVRKNAGVFDVSHMGEFFVKGPDAVQFVDEMITNDFASAPIGKAVYSPLCRDNGTVIDDLIAYKLEEQSVLICVNASNIEKDWNWLSAHKTNYQVELSNQSDDYSLIALQGPNAAKNLDELSLQWGSELPYYGARQFNDLIIARTGYTGEDGFEIFGPHDQIKNFWVKLIGHGVTPCGLAARDVLRLEVCYPLYGHELNDEITPLDAGLKWTVKTKKPKFIGLDALAHYKPKYKLARLSTEKGIPREGYSILDSAGETIGHVTSGSLSVTEGFGIAMGLISIDRWPEDDQFMIQIRQNNYPAKLHKKAFTTGGHK